MIETFGAVAAGEPVDEWQEPVDQSFSRRLVALLSTADEVALIADLVPRSGNGPRLSVESRKELVGPRIMTLDLLLELLALGRQCPRMLPKRRSRWP